MLPTALHDFIKSSPEISYNDVEKKKFKKLGQKFLVEVGEMFERGGDTRYKVGYNKGGIAVSGDHTLRVVQEVGGEAGFVVFLSESSCGLFWAMARTIESFDDHQGGQNQWIPDHFLKTPDDLYRHLKEIF